MQDGNEPLYTMGLQDNNNSQDMVDDIVPNQNGTKVSTFTYILKLTFLCFQEADTFYEKYLHWW